MRRAIKYLLVYAMIAVSFEAMAQTERIDVDVIKAKVMQNIDEAVTEWKKSHPQECVVSIALKEDGNFLFGYDDYATITHKKC